MRQDLQQKFYDRWPKWFEGRHLSIQESLMPFGFDHGDGWFELEWRLCEDLEKLLGEHLDSYRLVQIKEKFGTLRWYDNGNYPDHLYSAIQDRVYDAELESSRVCELCGKPGRLNTDRAWWQTLCEECRRRLTANPDYETR